MFDAERGEIPGPKPATDIRKRLILIFAIQWINTVL
jgi:hypothetical protein